MVADLIIILIIALCTFIGYKRGLIKVAIKLLSFIIAIIIALTLYKPTANYIIQNTEIDDNIQNAITEKILPEGATEEDEVEITTNVPEMILEGAENTVKSISTTLTTKLIEILSLIAIFIITKIILRVITLISNLIEKIPVIKQFNKAGGTIYGIIQGFLVCFTILAVISLISPFINQTYIEMINNSFLASKLYDNNILLNIIS